MNIKNNVITLLLAISAAVAGLVSFAPFAYASSSITINTIPPIGCQLAPVSLTITGSAIATAPPGQLQQYAVDINWGDGAHTTALAPGAFGSGGGTSASIPFSGSHTYTTVGTFSIIATVYHQSLTGQDNVSTGTNSFQVCVTPATASLTLTKTVTNDNGGTALPTAWTLAAAGPTPISGATGSAPVTNASVNPGTYTLSETGGPSGYLASVWTCTGATVSGGNTITLAAGNTVSCTINNNDIQPKLTVTKVVVNNNGGTKVVSDFPLWVNATGVTSGVQNGFNAGTYTVSETSDPTYVGVISGNCALNGSITLAVGDVKTCTITNDDIAPILHLVKTVTNDDGGLAAATDWTLMADGTGSNDVSGTTPVNSGATLQADTFLLSETGGPAGYAPSAWNCVGGTQNGSMITLGLGQEATCTINNNDIAPTLTLVKTVVNDNGGTKIVSDFPLWVNASLVVSGVPTTLMANTLYTATETNLFGYAPSVWGTDCTLGGTITLQPGENKTCTITNDDIAPQLTVIKHVINDDGNVAMASDFTMQVTGTNVSTPSFAGSEVGVTVSLNQGAYSADEVSNAGYTETLSTDCSGTINVGEVKTCTITNNDKPMPTRSQGFWQTHTTYTLTKLGVSSWTIGTKTINSTNIFSAFYAGISKKSNGSKRSALDQARMQMLQQWVAAKLNCAAFGCTTATQTLLVNSATAWTSGTASQILSYAAQLDAYNNSNEAIAISGQGRATPQTSQSQASTGLAYWDVLP